MSDLRFALRGLRRDRGFTITALVILTLAITLNATVFALMNTMLFRGFPLVRQNKRLVYMQERNPLHTCCLSYPDFEDWRTQAKSFEGMAFLDGRPVTLGGDGQGRNLDTFATTVSANTFGLLGVKPALGRDFEPADEAAGAPPVVLLSFRFWEARFGRRSDIVGQTVRINQTPTTVIGVMPKGFDFPDQENLWMPFVPTPEMMRRTPGGYMAFGRLKAAVSVAAARAELQTINRRLAAAYPETNRDVTPRVDTFSQFFLGPDSAMIYGSLWAAAWFVLLIACANLANLMLARTIGRSREFTTRLALGAGRWRMVRQLLIESVLLAVAAAVPSWWLTKGCVQAWAAATASRYQVLDYTVDSGTLGYLAAISLAAAALVALAPIGRVLQLDRSGIFTELGRGTTQGIRGKRLSAVLIAGQMTLAIVLLCGAGVLVRSFWTLVTAEVGVGAPERVLMGRVISPRDKYPTPESRRAFFDSLRNRLAALPGIESVALSSQKPLEGILLRPLEIESRTGKPAGVAVLSASPGYFRTAQASILAGREFNDRDRPTGLAAAIVNQSFAARFFPGEDPLGKRLRIEDAGKPGAWRTIVGVVSNIKQADPTRQHFVPLVYLPFAEDPPSNPWFFARTTAASAGITAAIRREVQKLDPDLVLAAYSTLKESYRFQVDQMDIEHVEMGKHAAVAPIFAGMALLLAAIGLYAVLAQSVGRRTREIGVRMAVGAAEKDVRGLIFREGMTPVAAGLALGLMASLGVNRILQSQLVGVSPYDPVTMVAAPLILIGIAVIGCHVPARRAMRIDPAVALRHD